MPTPCTQPYRPATYYGEMRRLIHHGNGTTDPHLAGAYYAGTGTPLDETISGPAGVSMAISGFGAAAVCESLANAAGVIPRPRGAADHSIIIPRDATAAGPGYTFRAPDYGDGVYSASLSPLGVWNAEAAQWNFESRLILRVAIVCDMANGTAAPILYFLGQTDRVADLIGGASIAIPNRLSCSSSISGLFGADGAKATIRRNG